MNEALSLRHKNSLYESSPFQRDCFFVENGKFVLQFLVKGDKVGEYYG